MVSQKPKYCTNFERNNHWRKLSLIMVWERYCNTSPKPEFFLFSLFIFSIISQLIRVRLRWNFHRWFSMQKQVNWCTIDPFSLKFLHKPTLLPSTFKSNKKYIHVSIALIVNDIIHDIITFLVAHVHSWKTIQQYCLWVILAVLLLLYWKCSCTLKILMLVFFLILKYDNDVKATRKFWWIKQTFLLLLKVQHWCTYGVGYAWTRKSWQWSEWCLDFNSVHVFSRYILKLLTYVYKKL